MSFFNIFNQAKPKQFNIKARFYDPKKEKAAMEIKLKEGKKEEYNEYVREKMRSEWRNDKFDARKEKASRRLIIYLILAGMILALLLIKFV